MGRTSWVSFLHNYSAADEYEVLAANALTEVMVFRLTQEPAKVETGQALLTSPQEAMVLLVEASTQMHTAIPALAVDLVDQPLPTEAVETEAGSRASTSLVLPTHVSSASSLVSSMTQPSNRLVSTSRSTTTSSTLR